MLQKRLSIVIIDARKEVVWIKNFYLRWKYFLVLEMRFSYIVIIWVPLPKARNKDHIQSLKTCSETFTSYVRLRIGRSRWLAKFEG